MSDVEKIVARTPLDYLVDGRKAIEDPARWLKGEYARDVMGVECYCAEGAVLYGGIDLDVVEGLAKEDWDAILDTQQRAKALLANAITKEWLAAHPNKEQHTPHFNDDPDTTHEDVLALFDRAIETAKGAQG